MVSNPKTREAEKQDKSVKFGINSVHTEKSSSKKQNGDNQSINRVASFFKQLQK